MRFQYFGSVIRVFHRMAIVVLALGCFVEARANGIPAFQDPPPSAATESGSLLPPEARGDLMMYRQQYLAAIDAYRQASQDSPVIWNKIGIAYHHLYALNEAKMDYEKAIFLNPRYSEAINNLGTIYYSEKNYRKAKSLYKKAIKLSSQSAVYYDNLATTYFADGKFKQGTEALNKAYSLDPHVFEGNMAARISEPGHVQQRAKLDYCMAKIYAVAGMKDRALEALRTAINEGFDDAKKLKADPEWASLRSTPEFVQLMAEEHLSRD
jgi:tetratricopeptide (TPR) repeat protein